MNFDNLIECSRCGSDACYVQEVNAEIKLEFCYGCGFQSNSLMKPESQFLQEQMEVLPELYKALMDEEEDKIGFAGFLDDKFDNDLWFESLIEKLEAYLYIRDF